MTDFNYIINASLMDELDKQILRKSIFNETEEIKELEGNVTIYDILVDCGLFSSKKEAKRNWKRGPIQKGFNDFTDLGKRWHRLTIMSY